MSQKDNLYFGGGSLYIIPFNNGVPDESQRLDIGCLELSLSKDSQKTTAWTRANGAKQKLAEITTEENYTLKIKGNNFSPEALSLVVGSFVEETTIKQGQPLPYGGTAAKDTFIKSLNAGSRSEQVTCRLEFIGRPVMGKFVHAIFYEVNLSLDGDLNLMAEEFSSLGLSGACVATDQGVYTYYYSDESGQSQSTQSGGPTQTTSQTQSAQSNAPTQTTSQSGALPSNDNDLEKMVEDLEDQAIKDGTASASAVKAARAKTKAANPDLQVEGA
ncbi:hypothetical protein HHE06_02320 [Helicobacter heilmannii]|uniref:hypothetical protein n=1 Tax=Helicobacter heilmannii TaxID=35817 RepID=UPI0006A093D6|nr:hypothetical protein [Helicobacter heilmannii]CRF50407.1 hypothetical protein HHE06_02320 [Helicobacter heilmannii]